MLTRTLALFLVGLLLPATVVAEPGSRLWATGGVTTIEGSAGGGLVPWALLSSYASDDEWGGTLSLARAEVSDFTLSVTAAALTWRNRVELSLARQTLDLDDFSFTLDDAFGLREDELVQDIFGAKLRVFGDVLYQPWGQWSLGVQHKRNRTFTVPDAIRARSANGTDVYLAGSKLFFAALLERNLLLNLTLRGSKANQGGLLGFGGDDGNSYRAHVEASAGVFLDRRWLVGAEYRQKSDNLSFANEDDWWDLFVAWVPSRHLAVTGAWVNLGDVATQTDQRGLYLSLQGTF